MPLDLGSLVGGSSQELTEHDRRLAELHVKRGDLLAAVEERHVEKVEAGAGRYRAVLQISEADGRRYVDKGWRLV